MELTICILTVLTISAFAYILADIDSPFHGFFRVDLTVFLQYLDILDGKYRSLTGAADAKTNGTPAGAYERFADGNGVVSLE